MTQPLALYIHWPFCLSKCPYCDFNSHVREDIDDKAWATALISEIRRVGVELPNRTITSIFFGGGTPSLMAPSTAAAVLDKISVTWPLSDDCEITLEANPNSVEVKRFRDFQSAGINRVSVGIQALRQDALTFLGRTHSLDEALRAIDTARDTFKRYTFDLIYARPDQTPAMWETELREALTRCDKHLSLYQLTIEPGTAFQQLYARGDLTPPGEVASEELYDLTQAIMEDSGLPAYEVSNHASSGEESRHNLTYWRYQDYAGIGPGAHGRVTIGGETYATRCFKTPEKWLENALRGSGEQERIALTDEEKVAEHVMMSLRLKQGLDLQDFQTRHGRPLAEVLPQEQLTFLQELGDLTLSNDRLRATPQGLKRLNAVLGQLLS